MLEKGAAAIRVGAACSHLAQIMARAEGRRSAGDHHRVNGFRRGNLRKRRAERQKQLFRQAVARFRPV
jgi:hypothetical protein